MVIASTGRGRSGQAAPRSKGFTYVWVLFAIALLGVGLVAGSEVWLTIARRQQAVQLEWVGEQFVHAIGSYYYASPGSARVYPATMEDLLEDRRFVTLRRHLRAIYVNPFTARSDWELIRGTNGGIVGVRVSRPSAGETQTTVEFVFKPVVSN